MRLSRSLLLISLFLAAPGGARAQATDSTQVSDPELRDELLAMRDEDQELRIEYVRQMNEEGADSTLGARVGEMDRRHGERMREILDARGWPGHSLVGREGSRAAWLLIQHADHDPGLQRRALDLMRRAVEAGEASSRDLAFLTDRVRKAEGRPQLYGTQTMVVDCRRVPYPIEDEERVDERRSRMGLPPLEEYLELRRRQLGVGPGCTP